MAQNVDTKYLVVADIWDQLCVSNSDMMFSLDINNINVNIHLLMNDDRDKHPNSVSKTHYLNKYKYNTENGIFVQEQ